MIPFHTETLFAKYGTNFRQQHPKKLPPKTKIALHRRLKTLVQSRKHQSKGITRTVIAELTLSSLSYLEFRRKRGY